MKRITLILILLASSGLFYKSVSQEGHYEINGRIEGAEGVKFTLQKMTQGKIINLDTTVVVNGMFKIIGGSVEYPEMVILATLDRKKMLPFFLENNQITITGRFDSLYYARVTGSKSQIEFSNYLRSTKPLTEKRSRLENEYKAATAAVNSEEKLLMKEFVINNPGSYVSPMLLSSIAKELRPEEFELMVNAMDSLVSNSPVMMDLKGMMAKSFSVSIGKKAPDFTINDTNGKPVSLSSKIGSRLLLVDFWAGWCGPCRQENPNVLKVYQQFKNKGFDIIGVSLDRTKDEWVKAIADDKLLWTQVSDLKYFNSPVAKLYNVAAIPANFLLDEKGTIIASNLRGEALYNKINDILGKK